VFTDGLIAAATAAVVITIGTAAVAVITLGNTEERGAEPKNWGLKVAPPTRVCHDHD
jgi:hypothetical protein